MKESSRLRHIICVDLLTFPFQKKWELCDVGESTKLVDRMVYGPVLVHVFVGLEVDGKEKSVQEGTWLFQPRVHLY